jgi:hypothetical protein
MSQLRAVIQSSTTLDSHLSSSHTRNDVSYSLNNRFRPLVRYVVTVVFDDDLPSPSRQSRELTVSLKL